MKKLGLKIKTAAVLLILPAFILPVHATEEQGRSYTYDNWGKSIPAPDSYIVQTVITGENCGTTSFNEPQDVFTDRDNNIYIADTGNNRIVVLDKQYSFTREITEISNAPDEVNTFNSPTGVFVSSDGHIFVCDTGNFRVVKLDKEGKCVQTFVKPDTGIMGESVEFRPTKVAENSTTGDVYVVASGVYMGLVCFNGRGEFQRFFGGNKVELTANVLMQLFFKKLFTKEQSEAFVRILPNEYSNLCIDADNFVYAVASTSQTSTDQLKKLNALGENVVQYETAGKYYPENQFGDLEKSYQMGTSIDNQFVDVDVSGDGTVAMLDSNLGHVFVYTQNSELLFIFGDKNDFSGSFGHPSAIASDRGNYLVLDSDKASLFVFKPTPYASMLVKALSYHKSGQYVESIDAWKNILKYNSNCFLAYRNIGKALLEQGEYSKAMTYFKEGNDKTGYSEAFKEYRSEFVRRYLVFLVVGVVAAFYIIRLLLRRFKKWLGYEVKHQKIRYR